jgi:hypothetical protein
MRFEDGGPMATKADLANWVSDSLRKRGGRATLLEVSKDVWQAHEADLRASGDLFYTWQYDLRWAATKLRQAGRMVDAKTSPPGIWEMTVRGKEV